MLIETSDILFAVDSIPAIFAVTDDPFIVFTSNAFAILGLRALYFMLAGMIHRFVYLKIGLAIVLIYVGFKMLREHRLQDPDLGVAHVHRARDHRLDRRVAAIDEGSAETEALAEAHPEALGGTSDVAQAEPVEVPRSSDDRGESNDEGPVRHRRSGAVGARRRDAGTARRPCARPTSW